MHKGRKEKLGGGVHAHTLHTYPLNHTDARMYMQAHEYKHMHNT